MTKITRLTVENMKRISLVSIAPDGNLVQITGKNGQGKTSVLDSVLWVLKGTKDLQLFPVRKGEERGVIKLETGEFTVTRTFRYHPDTGETTTQLRFENAEGFTAASPQKMLDAMVDSLSFDPLAFTRMKAADQFNTLSAFVPGVDFAGVAKANKDDFAARTDLNRQAKQAEAAAGLIQVPLNLPDTAVDDVALLSDLQSAAQFNADLDRERERRERLMIDIRSHAASIDQASAAVQPALDFLATQRKISAEELCRQIVELEDRIAALRADMHAITLGTPALLDTERSRLEGDVKAMRAAQEARQQAYDALPHLAATVDASAISARIAGARATNDAISARQRRDDLEKQAQTLKDRAAALTKAMEDRTAAKEAAIKAAKMPIVGLTFGDDMILLNGLPFDQASDAEQLRASIAIAMAQAPKLRVIRVRDGSLLDDDGIKLLAALADEADCQVWLERVDSTGSVGFVLEDGHLKDAPPPEKEAPKPGKAPKGDSPAGSLL